MQAVRSHSEGDVYHAPHTRAFKKDEEGGKGSEGTRRRGRGGRRSRQSHVYGTSTEESSHQVGIRLTNVICLCRPQIGMV